LNVGEGDVISLLSFLGKKGKYANNPNIVVWPKVAVPV
jgi:hypothetical protein